MKFEFTFLDIAILFFLTLGPLKAIPPCARLTRGAGHGGGPISWSCQKRADRSPACRTRPTSTPRPVRPRVTAKRWQVSWLAGLCAPSPSRRSRPPVVDWRRARRSQLRGQPRH